MAPLSLFRKIEAFTLAKKSNTRTSPLWAHLTRNYLTQRVKLAIMLRLRINLLLSEQEEHTSRHILSLKLLLPCRLRHKSLTQRKLRQSFSTRPFNGRSTIQPEALDSSLLARTSKSIRTSTVLTLIILTSLHKLASLSISPTAKAMLISSIGPPSSARE